MGTYGSIVKLGECLYYYMSQTYAFAATDDPPCLLNNWASLLEFLKYYFERGWTFA